MKSSRGGKTFGSGSLWSLGLPLVFFLCLVFFLAGFFGFALFSQQDEWSARPRFKPRLLEERSFDPLPHGKSGEASFNSIPFQVSSVTCIALLQEFSNEMRWATPRLPFWRVLKVLSWRPRALYFPNFASAEQCQTIVKIAGSGLKPSTLALRKGETAENTQGIRTSSGMFLSASEDKTGVLDSIEEKIARVTMIPRSHGESSESTKNFEVFKSALHNLGSQMPVSLGSLLLAKLRVPTTKGGQAFNILRYEIGQAYHSHYDAFNPAEYGPQKSQRVASFLLYLSDVQEGGETMFPFENGTDLDTTTYDFRECIGLKVKPRRGDGLLFYSLFPNGTIDPTSIHGSCPVIRGEKWVATKWIRDNVQFD